MIDTYMAIENEGRPACRATRGVTDADDSMAKVRIMLAKHSELLQAQSATLAATLARIKAIKQDSK